MTKRTLYSLVIATVVIAFLSIENRSIKKARAASSPTASDRGTSLRWQEIQMIANTLTPLHVPVIPSASATVTVNSTTDVSDGNTSSIASLIATPGPDGVISLREAIVAANNTAGSDTISFNIPGPGVKTIAPTSALPMITDTVTIDGYTQPGASPNTLAVGDNAVILIEINGSAGAGSAFIVNSPNNTFKGLVINRFPGASGDGGYAFRLLSAGNTIQGCFLGTNPAGDTAAINRAGGISVEATSQPPNTPSGGNIIGGPAAAARNVIVGGSSFAVAITGIDAAVFQGGIIGGNGNTIQGNYIGTNAAGSAMLGTSGITILTANNTIGGSVPGAGNVMFSNGGFGLSLREANATGNSIQGNFIGLTANGNASLGGNTDGITLLRAPNNRIGGSVAGAGNVISGNAGQAISSSETDGLIVQGNLIGTNAAGTAAVPNNGGIAISGNNNTIGGTTPGARNIISGSNPGNGIRITTSTTSVGNVIQGNYIGTDITGTMPLGNTAYGIQIFGEIPAGVNTVGGTTAAARNIISANGDNGIYLQSGNITVQGNYIGTDVNGNGDLGNGANGINVQSDGNTIGGVAPGAGNVIAFNGKKVQCSPPGVCVQSGNGIIVSGIHNAIRGNSIFANVRLGIDLPSFTENAFGVTPNDSCDVDLGPNNQSASNNLQNFPVITTVSSAGGSTTLTGTLNSTASTTFALDFFSNPACSPAGNGQGKTFLGSTQVTTDASCNANINIMLPVSLVAGQVVTATATDPAGNTSEFSACATITAPPPTVQLSAANYNVTEDCTLVQLIVTRSGDLSGTSSVDFATADGSALQRTDYTISFGTVSFAAGESSKIFSVPITEDHYVEGAEQFSAALSNPSGATLGSPNVASVTINDDDTAQSPSPSAKSFGGNLDGGQETPANNSTAKGIVLVELNQNETAANVSLNFSGLSSAQTAAHIHGPAARGVPAPILFPLPNGNFNSFQISLTSQNVADLRAGMLYVNVHSNNFPNGEIRAQLEFNPIDSPTLFVGQAYHDFLSRQADDGGQAYWESQLTNCGNNVACVRDRRIDVSNAFFYELEFQQTGSYAYRLYRVAYGNSQPFPNTDNSNQTEAKKLPSYAAFASDRARVIGGADLTTGQQGLAMAFVQRPEFTNKYSPGLSTAAQFVDAVLATIQSDLGVDLGSQRTALINAFNAAGGGNSGRAMVLYRLANDDLAGGNGGINNRPLIDAEYNRAFVATQYFGYLRRDPDIGGFLFWLGQVNRGALRDGNTQHGMVCSFITSAEYQQRFSSLVTHSNQECPQ